MKLSRGFTLIEIIVVMAIFLFVIGAALAIFISIVQHQKRVLSEQQILNQISYTEEYMSKAIRMAKVATTASDGNCLSLGYTYLLIPSSNSPDLFEGIKFVNQSDLDSYGDPICQQFFLDTDGILKEEKNNDPNTITPLTSADLQINFARFSIDGKDGSVAGQGCSDDPTQCGARAVDGIQPRVTILLNVKIAGDTQESSRTIQTTVSQRNLNVR